MKNLKFYSPGIMLILLAIVIIAVPQILVAIVAATIIMVGITALKIGHMMKKSAAEFDVIADRYFDDDFLGQRFARSSMFNKWRHSKF